MPSIGDLTDVAASAASPRIDNKEKDSPTPTRGPRPAARCARTGIHIASSSTSYLSLSHRTRTSSMVHRWSCREQSIKLLSSPPSGNDVGDRGQQHDASSESRCWLVADQQSCPSCFRTSLEPLEPTRNAVAVAHRSGVGRPRKEHLEARSTDPFPAMLWYRPFFPYQSRHT